MLNIIITHFIIHITITITIYMSAWWWLFIFVQKWGLCFTISYRYWCWLIFISQFWRLLLWRRSISIVGRGRGIWGTWSTFHFTIMLYFVVILWKGGFQEEVFEKFVKNCIFKYFKEFGNFDNLGLLYKFISMF